MASFCGGSFFARYTMVYPKTWSIICPLDVSIVKFGEFPATSHWGYLGIPSTAPRASWNDAPGACIPKRGQPIGSRCGYTPAIDPEKMCPTTPRWGNIIKKSHLEYVRTVSDCKWTLFCATSLQAKATPQPKLFRHDFRISTLW